MGKEDKRGGGEEKRKSGKVSWAGRRAVKVKGITVIALNRFGKEEK